MQLIIRWAVSAVALYITVLLTQHLLPGSVGLAKNPADRAIAMVEAVAVLAIVNAVVRPIVELLTLPLTCLTFGLFSFVINALMFWIVGHVVPGFRIHGFLAPLFASIVMGIVSGILSAVIIPDEKSSRGNRK